MGDYSPFKSDNELIEIIMPDRSVSGIMAKCARFLAERYVKQCKDFPDLIYKLGEEAQNSQDRNQKEALLYLKSKGELIRREIFENGYDLHSKKHFVFASRINKLLASEPASSLG